MYAEAVDDDKLRLLAFEDRWHFVALLCCKAAGVLDSDPVTLERRIAVKLGLMPKDLGEVKRRLREVNLIGDDWQPVAWGKRQFSSDSSTDRTRRWRQKQDETSRERHKDVTVTSQIRTDTEQNRTEQKGKRAARANTAHRLPENFELTPERQATAKAEAVNPEREFARFCDHWRAASGANARKLDWDAAWRNWCRKAGDFRKPQGAPSEPVRTWEPPEDEHATP